MTEYGPSGPEQNEDIDLKALLIGGVKAAMLIRDGYKFYKKNETRFQRRWDGTIEAIKEDPLSAKEIFIGSGARVYSEYIDDQAQREIRKQKMHEQIASDIGSIHGRKTEWLEANARADEAREKARQATEEAVREATETVRHAGAEIGSFFDKCADAILGPNKKKQK